MGRRLAGTENDIAISRTTTYPLENLEAPVLVIHGTQEQLVDFEGQAKMFEKRLPNVELLAIAGGEHIAIFTHRSQARARVNEFMPRHRATGVI